MVEDNMDDGCGSNKDRIQRQQLPLIFLFSGRYPVSPVTFVTPVPPPIGCVDAFTALSSTDLVMRRMDVLRSEKKKKKKKRGNFHLRFLVSLRSFRKKMVDLGHVAQADSE
ncbi:hypothetical protein TanjilG_32299 [Lupinus angustifolius]|uniref:Uncharacterized protein n=1 Tax=Lupinus angustifolius TaxID=3871 RepID=A0A4P1R0K4_LUPAN|nr:hypothetical protein TanjilG_32299 [Lupinus angustifolius]